MPKEAKDSDLPETGVTGGCEEPNVGTKAGSSVRAKQVLNLSHPPRLIFNAVYASVSAYVQMLLWRSK